MTYQSFAQRAIHFTLALMLVMFVWIGYHQFMSTMSMESMAGHETSPMSCVTFCFVTSKVDINHLIQSIYYSFEYNPSAFLTLLIISALSYVGLYHLSLARLSTNTLLRRQQRYYYQQRWKFKLFSLWSRLYQQGIIAPQVYS